MARSEELSPKLPALPMVLGLLLLLATSCTRANAEEQTTRPNIILIVADDLGYGELGCYGQKWIKTPHIDRMAQEGMRFTHFYSGQAVCAPSRCALLTGRHMGHAFIRDNGDPKHLQHLKKKFGWEFPGQYPLPEEQVTIAELLKDRGYATAAIGKWGLGHVGTSGDPNRQGFDLFYGFNCQRHAHNHYPKFLWRNNEKEILPGNDRKLTGQTFSQDKFTEVAVEFIQQHQDEPFFLYLPFAIPHLAIQVPEESLQEYEGVIPEQEYEHRGYLKHPSPRAGYAAMISHMDRDIGKIMAQVKTLGLDENTLVMFTSDNGPTYDRLGGSDSEFFQSATPLRGFKGSLYEGGIRVPLVARWPKQIAPRTVSEQLSAFWDLLPTFCQIAGADLPDDIDGISLVPTLLGKPTEQSQHEYLYWEFPSYGGQQAIRQGDWKAIRTDLLRKNNKPPLKSQLYNLRQDIGEQHDVALSHPEIVNRLEQAMRAAHVPSELFPLKPLDSLP